MAKGNQSKTALVRRVTALGLLLGGALAMTASCGGNTSAGTDSNTHWLRSCSKDTDCGSLECLCGVCTRSCKQASQCGGLGGPAVCEGLSICPGSAKGSSVCTAKCSDKSDCTDIGAALTCVDGRCENASGGSSDPTGSAGLEDTSTSGGRGSGGTSSATGGAPSEGGRPEAMGGTIDGPYQSGSGGSYSIQPGGAGGGTMGGAAPASGGAGGGTMGGAAPAGGGTDSTGGNVGSDGGVGGAAVTGDRLVLDPSSLVFFGTPTDSIRFGVVGYDPDQRTCATIVWEPDLASSPGAMCNVFEVSGENFYNPYVVIKTDMNGPCTEQDWDYQGNVTTTSSIGCVDFAEMAAGGVDMADVQVGVEGDLFTGTIVANNRPEGMVTFGLEYVTDVPADVYVQTGDDLALPAWLEVTKDGQPVWLFDRCDIPNCGISDGVCGIAFSQAANITAGSPSGSIYLTWDGQVWSEDEQEQCLKSAPATAGTYQLKVCYGSSAEDAGAGPVVEDPVCTTQEFTFPTDLVVVRVNNGG